MKKIILTLALSSLLFSCSSSNDPDDGSLIPISLTSRIVVAERSNQQDVQIAANQQTSFFVTTTGNAGNVLYDNVRLTADGNGNFSYSYQGGTVLYYPTEAINVDFYAVHPYSESASLSSVTKFAVKQDQTVLKNYYDSDLLYSMVDDIAKTRAAVPMVFDHKLSKISFTVREGAGVDLSGLTAISVMNVMSEIDMNLTDGTLVPVSGDVTEIGVYGVRGTTGSETQVSGMSAIIVPQSFVTDGSKLLFRLTISGRDFYYTPAVGILFEEGKIYSYILTVNNTGIEVTSSINNWYPGGETEGEVS